MEKNKNNSVESFVAYRSFEKRNLPDDERLALYDAVFAYGLRRESPTFNDVHLEAIWELITPQMDANYHKRLNGKAGGAPKGNQNARKQPKNNQKQANVNVNENENVNEELKPADGTATAETSTRSKFVKPSLQQVRDYCASQRLTVDAATFFDHYESVGWRVGNAPMKDWRAAARNWSRREQTPKNNVKRIEPHHNLEGGKADAFESIEATV